MLLKKFLYFPILTIFFLSSVSLAAYEIELKDTEQTKSFVRPSGKVYDKYIASFTNDARIEYFSTIIDNADNSQKKDA